MFRFIKCLTDEKPVLQELSIKQREMIVAYCRDMSDRQWPQLRARPERIMIPPPQRPNTPVDTGRLAVIDEEPGSPTRKRYVGE